jgi:cation diffusion facilitator CzcD-associated flavoprotein CzcO
MPNQKTDLLIIGAGPFGLAIAAQAAHLGIDYLVVGKPMEFWRKNMPAKMFLRSSWDWHLDPLDIHTIERFLESRGQTTAEIEPLSLDFYLEYAEWFQTQKGIIATPRVAQRLDRSAENGSFVTTTSDGNTIEARNVALAPGFRYFANVPEELKTRLPAGRYEHTCEFVDFSAAANKRYLIVGGRQSAFEWAALLLEAGAQAVYVSHRHESPAFAVSDWSWVEPLVDRMNEDPNWFRRLSTEEKDTLNRRLWAEGRLKLEPWLEPRITNDRVRVLPRTEIVECVERNAELFVTFSDGQTLTCDEIVLATGYKVEIGRIPFLANGNVLPDLETRNGFPILDEQFQTSVPRLFITSMPATQDFGPFFGFTVSVRASAKLICKAVKARSD